MPEATIDGIEINYEEHGAGPALLMLAPGGFDSTIDKWRTAGVGADGHLRRAGEALSLHRL